jgi:CDP-diglyceride synthetase
MKSSKKIWAIILAVIGFLGLGVALFLYFNDLPFLWTITLLVIVLSTGIIGYVLGYLFGQRKS